MKYVKRCFYFPFVCALALLGCLVLWVQRSIYYLKYGGEFILHTKNRNETKISDVMNYLIEKLEAEKQK